MAGWQTATAPDGRTYYYRGTETSWEKPADYDPEDEWQRAERDGKVYFYNKITKETAWKHPKEAAAPATPQAAPAQAPAFVAGGGHPRGGGDDFGAPERRMDRREARHSDLPQKPSGGMPWEERAERGRHDGTGFRGPMPIRSDEPEYGSHERNEEAFFNLMRKHNISPDTMWVDAMKQVMREKDFRALKDPRERKQAFEKYCRETREQEKGKELERQKKTREDFRKMLTTHEEIKHYTRWKTARPMIEREAVFKAASNDEVRRPLFEEYVSELKRKHDEKERSQMRSATQDLGALLNALITDPETTWTTAREMVESNERFAREEQFRALHNIDILRAFDTHMRRLHEHANEKKQVEKRGAMRRERQARDQFNALLGELRAQGKIKAGTKWTELHPLIAHDERYRNLIGMSGSTPMDLFWDVVELEERALRTKKNSALDVLDEQRYEMELTTTLDDFKNVMSRDKKTADLTEYELDAIYERLMDKVKKRAEEDKLYAERHQRKAIDALRSVIKRLEPPVRLQDKFEDIAPKLKGVPEFDALDDEARRTAFEKVVRRLKEKEEDLERDRARRERSHRNGSRRVDDRDHRRHRTRTPEDNAYEADRRKAQADRERSYRRASFGLSPPPRDRRDERDDDRRYRGRGERESGVSGYDRERREREMERERNYVSRADPRDAGVALHYGDEEDVGSRSVRKRRGSEASRDGRKDVKVGVPPSPRLALC